MHTLKNPSTRLRLAQDDILSSFAYFEFSPTLAVAVSGGADSMALLLLSHAWAKKRGGRTIALTVDHRMRKESAGEAAQVKSWCTHRGIEHHTLLVSDRPANQSDARNARYAQLTEWCRAHHILHLLTAHHQDDQAETFFFRLARGSFLEGLASIPAISVLNGVRLLRPLLGHPKSELEDFLRQQDQGWVHDASNDSMKYTRNIIRSHLASAPDVARRGATIATRVAMVRNRLDHRLAGDLCQMVDIFPRHAVLKQAPLLALPASQGTKILQALVQTFGHKTTQPRTEKLRRLYTELSDSNPPRQRSLSGCRFRYLRKSRIWRVEPEPNTPHMDTTCPMYHPPKPLAGSAFLGLNTVQDHE
jgi:tRNA(Ile)-lysidine synthase